MKKAILSILLGMLLLPMVMAVSLNDSVIEGGTNTNITVNDTIYYDVLVVGDTGIYFENLRLSDSATEKLTFNITEADGDYYVNTTDYELPYISLSNSSHLVISNNLNAPFNVTIIASGIPCATTSTVNKISGVTISSGTVASFSCVDDTTISATIYDTSGGTITLQGSYYRADTGICEQGFLGMTKLLGVFAILLVVATVGMFLLQGMNFTTGDFTFDIDTDSWVNVVTIAGMSLVILAITFAVAVQICA